MKHNSTFIVKAAAAAAALACMTGAHATGTFAVVGGTVLFSTEATGPATALTMPDVVYTIGVPRGIAGQDFAIIYKLPAGATFLATPANPVYVGPSTPTITLKRGGAGSNDVVFSVSPTVTGVIPGDTFTLTLGVVNTHGMVGNGASFPVQVTILDQNETACVDNSGTPATCFKSATAASLAQSSNFLTVGGVVGVTTDPGATTTNVNAVVPLAGFVVDATAPADTATVAAADLILKNTTFAVRNPTNTLDYTLLAADKATINITDPTGFLGLATPPGLFIDLDADATADTAGTGLNGNEIFTISGTTASLLIDGNNVPNPLRLSTVYYTSNGVTPMGVSRVLGVSGSVNPTVAGIADLPWASNAAWWTWGSNGTVLETPFFTTFPGQNSRFVFMNYGTAPASYTAECLVEAGNTRTLGAGAAGTLGAGQQTVVQAPDVCTFSGNTRAAVRFTVNAPNTVIKAVYNVVNQATGGQTTVEMLRPGSN